MIVRLATHADRLPKSSQRRSCLLAEPKDTAKSLDEAISVQPLVNSRGAGLAYDFFRFLRRPHGEQKFIGGSYTNAELFELLHLLRPLILHREPASFSSVRAILGQCFRDKHLAAELKGIQFTFDHGHLARYMQIQIGEQKLFDETLLRLWLNGTQYHTDLEKAAAWRDFERSLTNDSARVLLMNQLRDKVNGLMLIAQIVRAVLGYKPRSKT